jgi:hypothetical protein
MSMTVLALLGVAFVEAAAPVVAVVAGWVIELRAPPELVLAGTVVGTLALLVWLVPAGRLARLVGVAPEVVRPMLSAVVLLGGFFCLQSPILDRFRSEKPFALTLREEIAGVSPERIAFVQHVPAFFPFYLELPGPVRVLRDPGAVTEFIESGGEWVIASRKGLARLGEDLPAVLERAPDLEEQVHPWEGPRASKWMAWRARIRGMGGP